MSDVISDVTRFRARLVDVRNAVVNVRDVLLEHECDCPPEWPRCAVCNARMQLRQIERNIENELKKVKL